jgi:hypothetical protein
LVSAEGGFLLGKKAFLKLIPESARNPDVVLGAFLATYVL